MPHNFDGPRAIRLEASYDMLSLDGDVPGLLHAATGSASRRDAVHRLFQSGTTPDARPKDSTRTFRQST